MKFREGYKVRIKPRVLASMSPRFATRVGTHGIVTLGGHSYTKVIFPNSNMDYWFTNRTLELVKNQQLLFSFMY